MQVKKWNYEVFSNDEGGPYYFDITNENHSQVFVQETREAAESVARFMAAAPQLLEALKRYGKHEEGCPYVWIGQPERECKCGLLAAIKLAEGDE